MSQGNQSCLRFSLEESVWFQRGQEVAELVSISLDPNITIQDNEQYVSIRGSLELTGEYTCHEQQQENDEEQLSALKYVHSVMEREEGVNEFLHRFPVDITIPKNRIESIYDIDIQVEGFDYVFPEKDRLKLTADLAITGLYGEQQHEADQETDSEEVEELEVSYREEATEEVDAEVEAAYAETGSHNTEDSAEPDFPEAPAYSFVQQNETLNQEEQYSYEEELYAPFRAEARKEADAEELTEPELQEQREHQPVPEYALSDFRGEPEPVAEVEVEQEEEVEVELEIEDQPEAENVPAEMEESPESSSSPVLKKKKPNMKQGISIAEFLARKEEETEVAKIRVCIVQQGDSLQSISERYDVPVQQLLRVNHLSIDHEVHEGQVLYVPGVAVHNT
ncbi:stage VI sporulation protein D [Mesobacillus selenatarsenatis]|uniref:Stage VI sporulation protein D n=1 Tax=Mesobacillus selenatarsenatis (strain DSM 18680 / JCM 14380 / FERM P-15431 / SF-1) TaxID=1321606 RepID=A0A0A8WZ99_MESS1|nr:stage VI sporulation protein D [Mesobacillus selenatarsenatis]GAM12082.1 stage VI sporulation protein D [Mesobacillus selenatarsenatis SF-1]